MDAANPLTDEHLRKLDEVLSSCAQTSELCRRLRAAGLPADQAEAENAKQAEIARNLKAQFFPGNP